MSYQAMESAYNRSTRSQAFPLFGPAIASPITATVSLVHFVASSIIALVCLILSSLTTCCDRNETLGKKASDAGDHMILAARNFAFSIGNMITLGTLACCNTACNTRSSHSSNTSCLDLAAFTAIAIVCCGGQI